MQIGAPAAVPALAELLRRRGMLGSESPEVRIAAARALSTIGSREALAAIESAAAVEPDGSAKATLQRLAGQR